MFLGVLSIVAMTTRCKKFGQSVGKAATGATTLLAGIKYRIILEVTELLLSEMITITGVNKIVHHTKDFVISQGSTVRQNSMEI